MSANSEKAALKAKFAAASAALVAEAKCMLDNREDLWEEKVMWLQCWEKRLGEVFPLVERSRELNIDMKIDVADGLVVVEKDEAYEQWVAEEIAWLKVDEDVQMEEEASQGTEGQGASAAKPVVSIRMTHMEVPQPAHKILKPFPHSLVVLSHAILPSKIGKDLRTPHISTALPPNDAHFTNSSDMAASTSIISLVLFARDHGYVYLPGVPTSFCPEASWYIPSSSAPSQPIQVGQRVLLVSMTSRRTFFGRLRSVIRLERSSVVVSVPPVQEAYGSFLPAPCNVFIPVSSIILPKLRQLQYNLLFSTLPDCIHDEYDAHLASLLQDTAEDAPPSSSPPTKPYS
ncbi:hypothetical protein BKA82DRAFT_4362491 [Pisolithus tinctorius]|nr:hypothetical protein BKA82DRAFT_4362491 [Pisolithus tinctorius]